MSVFKFANPEFLYLFLAIPLFVIGFILLNIAKRKSSGKAGDIVFGEENDAGTIVKNVLILNFG
jgi:hypothetical protein